MHIATMSLQNLSTGLLLNFLETCEAEREIDTRFRGYVLATTSSFHTRDFEFLAFSDVF